MKLVLALRPFVERGRSAAQCANASCFGPAGTDPLSISGSLGRRFGQPISTSVLVT